MASIACPSCKRINMIPTDESAKFTCDQCDRLLERPAKISTEIPRLVPVASPDDDERQSYDDDPSRPSPPPSYRVSKVCPNCGGTTYKTRQPERTVAFMKDRICRECGTRYAPPTPMWAAIVFIVAGGILGAVGLVGLLGVLFGHAGGALASLVCGGVAVFAGCAAIYHGIRCLANPGKV